MNKPDHIIENINPSREIRQNLITECDIHDTTELTKTFGITWKTAITNKLYMALYPWAEDASSNICFAERIEDMIKKFEKNASFMFQAEVRFQMSIETKVKSVTIDANNEDEPVQVITYPDGIKRTKILEVFVGQLPDENLEPSIVFDLEKII